MAQFYRPPGDTPHIETVLAPGEMIAKVRVPASAAARNSCYLKVRDRASFAFALVSAAVGLDIADHHIRDARVALGGVGPMPWRLTHVESALRGQRRRARNIQVRRGTGRGRRAGTDGNNFKAELACRTVLRATPTPSPSRRTCNVRGSEHRSARRESKVLGQAKYAAEDSANQMAHAILVQSTVAAGTISGVDTSTAKAMPGVLEILTPDNADKLNVKQGAQQMVRFPLLQGNDVLYSGQHVAVVVAETLQQAQAAAAKVSVRYKPAEAVTIMDTVLSQSHEPKKFDNGRSKPDSKVGDPDAAMRGAAATVDATYITPIEHHNPMESQARSRNGTAIACWCAPRRRASAAAQQTLATLFNIPKDNVTVICPFVGGGFGCKGNTWPHVALTAMAARKVNRPVKLEVTRQQMFTSNGYRPRTIQNLRSAPTPTASCWRCGMDGLSQMSQPQIGEFAEAVGLSARMLYACPNIATTHRLVRSIRDCRLSCARRGGIGQFRARIRDGRTGGGAVIDPVELRLRNYSRHRIQPPVNRSPAKACANAISKARRGVRLVASHARAGFDARWPDV